MIFSTQDVHPRERLSYWLEVATRGYVEHHFQPGNGGSFSGSVSIATLPGLGLANFQADEATVTRTDRNAARADSGDLLLCLHLSGEVVVSQDGSTKHVKDRSLFLMDPLRAFDIHLKRPTTSIVVRLPRAMLEARVGSSAGLTAQPVTAESSIAALAMGFLEMLPKQAESLDDTAGLKVADQLVDLAALALTRDRERGAALSSPRAIALMRLKATIERLLIEHNLKPDRIAAETGISVRYANSLLAEEGWSIERYVNERRLERCRGALNDPAQDHRSIGDIAFKWGFSDLSHFGRRFKVRFGQTPTEYRTERQRAVALYRPARPGRIAIRELA
jgi:AraC family transcriptional activator of tynA and feaB